jgi:uncharacterized membrane protein (UPF0136 family)
MLIFWGVFYVVLLVAITVTVVRIGERQSVIAITIVVVGTLLTVASIIVSQAQYKVFDGLAASVDFLLLGALYWQAITSRRYWTLCLPALQLITCFTHVVKYVAPEFLPRLYLSGQGFWTYPMLALILAASLWARGDRKAREQQEGEGQGRGQGTGEGKRKVEGKTSAAVGERAR